jgi:hypothetical protein
MLLLKTVMNIECFAHGATNSYTAVIAVDNADIRSAGYPGPQRLGTAWSSADVELSTTAATVDADSMSAPAAGCCAAKCCI